MRHFVSTMLADTVTKLSGLRMNKIKLVTIRGHGKEYDKGKCPSKDNTECYQGNCDIDEYGDDAEEN